MSDVNCKSFEGSLGGKAGSWWKARQARVGQGMLARTTKTAREASVQVYNACTTWKFGGESKR
jgi:hypothetical protein